MGGVWVVVVAACLVPAGLALRRLVVALKADLNFDQARRLFRYQREGLEARFLIALGRFDPIEHRRWEDARWHDEVVWARDRQTRRLLALVGVHFEPDGAADPGLDFDPPHHATALFEFRKGRWHADGKRIDEVQPDEAILRHQRFEPV
jgi:hypothetical protein